jgi:glycosyltransferase involved in cell wall biosynthesis
MNTLSKVAVAQLGARKHFQEPILMKQWGILDTLYTDLYAGSSCPMQVVRHPWINPYLPSAMKRLIDRYDPELKDAKIVHFPRLGYKYAKTLKQLGGQNPTTTFIETGKAFCQKIIEHGLGDADTVYGFNSACLELFKYAKQQGLRCILDQTLAERSYYYRLMQAEEVRWPDWSISSFKPTSADQEMVEREQQEQDLANQIICGSEFVKDSLLARGAPDEKVTVVPLGRVKNSISLTTHRLLSGQSRAFYKGRHDGLHILFAGSLGLRKGVPYLLNALLQLKGKIPFVCKAAGSIQLRSEVLERYDDVCQFLGQVPRSEMAALYSWADVFVLPSLCEGSAMVTYEALRYNLPIITTRNAGSIIRDGLGGWIVPAQSADAIAESLLKLYEQDKEICDVETLKSHFEQVENQAFYNFAKQFSMPR